MRWPPPGHLEPTGEVDAIELYHRFGVGWVLRRRLRWIASLLGPGPQGRVLEVGYGSGVFQYELASRARLSVGLDLHPYGARVRRALAADGVGGELVRGDAARLPFAAGSFDRVVFASVLEFVPDPGRCLRQGLRLLAPGGRLILLTPRPLWWADRLWDAASGWSAASDFRSGRERVQRALAEELPAARRLPRPSWLPPFLAPYEVVVWEREAGRPRGGPRSAALEHS